MVFCTTTTLRLYISLVILALLPIWQSSMRGLSFRRGYFMWRLIAPWIRDMVATSRLQDLAQLWSLEANQDGLRISQSWQHSSHHARDNLMLIWGRRVTLFSKNLREHGAAMKQMLRAVETAANTSACGHVAVQFRQERTGRDGKVLEWKRRRDEQQRNGATQINKIN